MAALTSTFQYGFSTNTSSSEIESLCASKNPVDKDVNNGGHDK